MTYCLTAAIDQTFESHSHTCTESCAGICIFELQMWVILYL